MKTSIYRYEPPLEVKLLLGFQSHHLQWCHSSYLSSHYAKVAQQVDGFIVAFSEKCVTTQYRKNASRGICIFFQHIDVDYLCLLQLCVLKLNFRPKISCSFVLCKADTDIIV